MSRRRRNPGAAGLVLVAAALCGGAYLLVAGKPTTPASTAIGTASPSHTDVPIGSTPDLLAWATAQHIPVSAAQAYYNQYKAGTSNAALLATWGLSAGLYQNGAWVATS